MTIPYTPGVPSPSGQRQDLAAVALSQAIATNALNGWRLEYAHGSSAVMISGRRPNHALHGVLAFLTAGLWSIIWLAEVIGTYERRLQITADPSGHVSYQTAKSSTLADLVGPIAGIVCAVTILLVWIFVF